MSAPWSAVRNAAHSYGFAAFTVDPGSHPGDFTKIAVTYYDVVGTDGQLVPFETFTLRRPPSRLGEACPGPGVGRFMRGAIRAQVEGAHRALKR
jgi:hypothetical protein